MNGDPIPLRERCFGLLVMSAAVAAVVVPMFWPLTADSFPLSTYPMFATPRGQPVIHRLRGVTQAGERRPIGTEALGTSEVLQAKAWIDAAAGHAGRRNALCKKVANWVAATPSQHEVGRVELERVRFDPVAYFVAGPEPLERRTLASCPVSRAPDTAGAPDSTAATAEGP